ncbi:retinol dehydrogenase 11-like [Ixodes scapularis]|uniref:retinol dehydrogenase 11-like n=1 Tax=Ixodes scapularis TaxID=6945 RepID=UPI001A9D6DA7|nr:retinol dehydrogenase 11-like [Ixodes scapularis]
MEEVHFTPMPQSTYSGTISTVLWITFGAMSTIFTLLLLFDSVRLFLVQALDMLLHSGKGVCRSTQLMEGKTVIVTGGSSGIGKETAKELARRKARVIIACRNITKAKEAAEEILDCTQQKVVVKHLDLASLKSVRKFAKDILLTEPRLDVLINNAGMVYQGKKLQLTEDGYEVTFQTNYLGPFLLTLLLVELLKENAPSRVVNLTSLMHHVGATDRMEDRIRGNTPWTSPAATYSHTQMAVLMATFELARRLRIHGIQVNAVHPGTVKTAMVGRASGMSGLLFSLSYWLFGKTAKEGAQTSIYAAVDTTLLRQTGYYLADCRKGWPSWRARNDERNRKLFEMSVKLVHLEPSELGRIFERICYYSAARSKEILQG